MSMHAFLQKNCKKKQTLQQIVNVRIRVAQPTKVYSCELMTPANILCMSSVTDLMSEVGFLS